MRLLLDRKNKRPVLFLDRYYGDKRCEEAVIQMAIRKAKEMRLPLVSLSGTGGAYAGELESLGGCLAPYEYCDAVHGMTERGKFTIRGAEYIYSPDNA